jgi:probable F420-dependent oxidoreductase
VTRDFRFGVGVRRVRSRAEFRQTARRFEDLGFDVLHIPDHLGAPAPFPVLAAAAQATTTIRLGTYVLNAAFYKSALLARDAAEVNVLSDGRLELGLGTGFVREEFAAAELPYPSFASRLAHLEHVTTYLKQHVSSVPILIAGNAERLLTLAAKHADIIGLTGTGGDDRLAARIAFVRTAAGDRFDDLELNIAITGSPTDSSGVPNLRMTRRFDPHLSDEQLLALPSVLQGSPREIADTIRGYRETFGLTYLTIQDGYAEYFAKVIAELR